MDGPWPCRKRRLDVSGSDRPARSVPHQHGSLVNWHLRLGHVHLQRIRAMVRNGVVQVLRIKTPKTSEVHVHHVRQVQDHGNNRPWPHQTRNSSASPTPITVDRTPKVYTATSGFCSSDGWDIAPRTWCGTRRPEQPQWHRPVGTKGPQWTRVYPGNPMLACPSTQPSLLMGRHHLESPILFDPNPDPARHIDVYTDADWANDVHTRQSVTGWVVFCRGCPVDWSVLKQVDNSGGVGGRGRWMREGPVCRCWSRSCSRRTCGVVGRFCVCYCDGWYIRLLLSTMNQLIHFCRSPYFRP